jgi:hypothetical protein
MSNLPGDASVHDVAGDRMFPSQITSVEKLFASVIKFD